MAVTEQGVLDALKQVIDPNTGRDFVSTKAVRNVQIAQDAVSFDIELGYPAKSQLGALRSATA
jgi:ATP-binding protein involved in chromosome partitioning